MSEVVALTFYASEGVVDPEQSGFCLFVGLMDDQWLFALCGFYDELIAWVETNKSSQITDLRFTQRLKACIWLMAM
jgi:hypothetical protein